MYYYYYYYYYYVKIAGGVLVTQLEIIYAFRKQMSLRFQMPEV